MQLVERGSLISEEAVLAEFGITNKWDAENMKSRMKGAKYKGWKMRMKVRLFWVMNFHPTKTDFDIEKKVRKIGEISVKSKITLMPQGTVAEKRLILCSFWGEIHQNQSILSPQSQSNVNPILTRKKKLIKNLYLAI